MPLAGSKRKASDTEKFSLGASRTGINSRTGNMIRRRNSSGKRGLKFNIAPPPFRHAIAVDSNYAERTWSTLREAILEINRRNTSDLSFEELYRYGYNMVLHKQGKVLYKGLETVQKDHLVSIADIIRKSDGEEFLKTVEKQWNYYKMSLGHVRDIFMYLDRTYIRDLSVRTVYKLGIYLFKEMVVYDEIIAKRLIGMLLDKIDNERNGGTIDTQLIKSITRMLAELGDDDESSYAIYCDFFENDFLGRTSQFYARESQLFFAESSCQEYLKKAAKRIEEEKFRVNHFLDDRSLAKVQTVVENELIAKYMKRLIEMENSGFIWMLRNNKVYDLRLMYSLFRNVPGGEDILRNYLKKEILERGHSLVADTDSVKDTVPVVESLLKLKEKCDRILNIAFTLSPHHAPTANGQDKEDSTSTSAMEDTVITNAEGFTDPVPEKKFINAVNEAFERFLHTFTRAPEYLSLYIDKLLRQDFKSRPEDEIEIQLQSVMTLFRYLHEKDAFERYYKLHLTKRLLHGKSASVDAETSFISKLKNECGYVYTGKMEQMFADINTSGETMTAYHLYVTDNADVLDIPDIELDVRVLTTVSWPIQSGPPCSMPSDITRLREAFAKFYDCKFSGRKLTWQPALGTVELKARFGGNAREHRLCVTSYAMCVLLLFNSVDCLTYEEIAELTGIPKPDLIRTLQSVSLAKYRVLIREPKRKDGDIISTDRFRFNDDFKCKLHRVKIQMVSARKESEAEQQKTRIRIDDDRKPLIEAAIVRVMKQHKTLDHNMLISEVVKLVSPRFVPDPSDIKKRIESLVDREFLEREEDQHAVYKYVA